MKHGKKMLPGKAVETIVQTPEALEQEDEWESVQLRRYTLWLPTREQLRLWAPLAGIILLGAMLRFWGLGDKPLHHDESLHAYFSLQLLHNLENWPACFTHTIICYKYDPLLHGPFQFHAIALMYKISQWLGIPDRGVNTTTLRLAAALLGTVIVALPYLLRDYLGRLTSLLACFLLAIAPSMVYYSRFAREDIYMACFTLLLVVAAGCYTRERKRYWLVIACVAFALSYATKEATFLSIAVFGSFFVALLIWEAGARFPMHVRFAAKAIPVPYLPQTASPLALLIFFLLCIPFVKWFFSCMKALSIYATRNVAASDVFVRHLKDQILSILPWLAVALGAFLVGIIVRERGQKSFKGRRDGLARYIDPARQPVLDMLVTLPWRHWLPALLAGASLFVLLFSVLLTNFPQGIADGIWQGLYYWLQQQQVARGGQPWYYYLLLLPLYEQIGVVFGIVGIVRCLRRPSRFRLFLVYWFLGNLFIYSWAGEKMPWLTIHITMPMMVLAALGLAPSIQRVVNLVQKWRTTTKSLSYRVQSVRRRNIRANVGAIFATAGAIVLLLLTLQNMWQVSFVHYADGPHEMMIYVQTTTDVDLVMQKVDALDQRLYGGKHQLNIGVVPDGEWPFYWYLRDYTNVCYGFPVNCAKTNPEIIISGGDNLALYRAQYTASRGKSAGPAFLFHEYRLRAWWDEGYKPPACMPAALSACEGQQATGGVGSFLWLSYGDTPPTDAQFDPGLAVLHVWQWWWERKAIGSTAGATAMGLFIRSDAGLAP